MADPILSNPLGVDIAQGNVYYNDPRIERYAADPYGVFNTITGISSANPAVVTTTNAHGYVTGQPVSLANVVTSVAGVSALQMGYFYTATVISATTFSINVNTTGGTYTYGSGATSAYASGAYVPGQLVYLPSPASVVVSGSTITPTWNSNAYATLAAGQVNYPIVELTPVATQNLRTLGVVLGGASPGSYAYPNNVVQVQTGGLATVLTDAVGITNGQLLYGGSGTNPGMPASIASGSVALTNVGFSIGSAITTSAGTTPARVPGLVILKPS